MSRRPVAYTDDDLSRGSDFVLAALFIAMGYLKGVMMM